MEQILQRTECSYTRLERNVHKFVFHGSNHRAVDEHVDRLEEIYRSTPPSEVMLVLIDLRQSGWPPMSYTFNAVRNLNRRYPQHPRSRYAFVTNAGFFISMASAFFNLLNPSGGTARFFLGDKESEAVAWLAGNN